MAQRRLSVFAVNTADWLKYRPYNKFSSYDAFYLSLSNKVYDLLNDPSGIFAKQLPRSERIELAVVLTSLFEDHVNDIGLWQAFLMENKKLHGYYLPFYDLTDYDPEYLNPEDLAYLIWHYCGKTNSLWITPNSQALLDTAFSLYELFEEHLERAPANDFYHNFLHIPEDIHFFRLKAVMKWLALDNYLLGPEFSRVFDTDVRKLLQSNSNSGQDTAILESVIYGMQNDYLYHKASSFLAYNVPDWFVLVARSPESLWPHIKGLSHRVQGEFIYTGTENNCYLLQHPYTERVFQVNSESCSIAGAALGDAIFTTLVPWKGEYWISGTLIILGTPSRKKADLASNEFYAWPPEKQQRILDDAATIEADFLEYFGDRLLFFETQKELELALEGQRAHYNSQLKQPEVQRPASKGAYVPPKNPFKGIDFKQGLGLFYEPGVGNYFSPALYQIARNLQEQDLSLEQQKGLFRDFFLDCGPELSKLLLERYPTHNLRFPTGDRQSALPYVNYLLRYFNPGAFIEKTPMNTLMK